MDIPMKNSIIALFGVVGLLGCSEEHSQSLSRSESLTRAGILTDITEKEAPLGTQVGNPFDPYELALLLNGDSIDSESIQILPTDIFSCSSLIDVSEFEEELGEGSLSLTYFVMVGDQDSPLRRNFMHQVRGQGLFDLFGLGSNLSLRCQAVIYTASYQIVFSHTTEAISCLNCGLEDPL